MYLPPIIQPPKGPDLLSENEVKANFLGNLAGLIGNAYAAKQKVKQHKQKIGRGEQLAKTLKSNKDYGQIFQGFTDDSLAEMYATDPNKFQDEIASMISMSYADKTKNHLADLKATMDRQEKYSKVVQMPASLQKTVDSTFGSKEEGEKFLGTYGVQYRTFGFIPSIVPLDEGILGSGYGVKWKIDLANDPNFSGYFKPQIGKGLPISPTNTVPDPVDEYLRNKFRK